MKSVFFMTKCMYSAHPFQAIYIVQPFNSTMETDYQS